MIALLVARNTFRETTRDRLLTGLVVAGLVMLGLTQIASPLALGEGSRITIDLGLTAIGALGVFLVLLVGTSMVAKEIERRTVYNLLSRPIARHDYLIGKWVGMSLALWVLCVVLGVALGAVLALRGVHHAGGSLVQAIYLTGLELTVITSIAVLFSALSTPVLSALYTLAVFLIGTWTYDLRAFAEKAPPTVAATLQSIANVAPNLPIFNMRALAAAAQTTSGEHLLLATIYAAAYCACMLALATAAFESRDFK